MMNKQTLIMNTLNMAKRLSHLLLVLCLVFISAQASQAALYEEGIATIFENDNGDLVGIPRLVTANMALSSNGLVINTGNVTTDGNGGGLILLDQRKLISDGQLKYTALITRNGQLFTYEGVNLGDNSGIKRLLTTDDIFTPPNAIDLSNGGNLSNTIYFGANGMLQDPSLNGQIFLSINGENTFGEIYFSGINGELTALTPGPSGFVLAVNGTTGAPEWIDPSGFGAGLSIAPTAIDNGLTFYDSDSGQLYSSLIQIMNGLAGFNIATPNEAVTVNGALSLTDLNGSVPTADTGFGKIYVNGGDLYFLNDNGDSSLLNNSDISVINPVENGATFYRDGSLIGSEILFTENGGATFNASGRTTNDSDFTILGNGSEVIMQTNVANGFVGFGLSSPTDIVTINGTVSLADVNGSVPSASTGFGKLYVNGDDLFYLDSNGGITQLNETNIDTGTLGDIVYYDSNGNPAKLAIGVGNQILTVNGATNQPEWQAPAPIGIVINLEEQNPVDNANGVGKSDNIVATFNTMVLKGNGDITIQENGGPIFETIPVSSSRVSISNNVVTIDPSSDFALGADYFVNFAPGTLVSAVDTSINWSGLSDNGAWSFTTGIPNLEVSSRNPSDEANNVSRTKSFAITFSVPVNLVDLAGPEIIIEDYSNGSAVANFDVGNGDITLSGGSQTVNFDPTGKFAYFTRYNVMLVDNFIQSNPTPGQFITDNGSSNEVWDFRTVNIPNINDNEQITFTGGITNELQTGSEVLNNFNNNDTHVTQIRMYNTGIPVPDATTIEARVTIGSDGYPSSVSYIAEGSGLRETVNFPGDQAIPTNLGTMFDVEGQEFGFYVNDNGGNRELVLVNLPNTSMNYAAKTVQVYYTNNP